MRENVTTIASTFPLVAPDEDNQNNVAVNTSVTNQYDPKPFLSLQLNSEYRSTYQWHDFKPPIQSIGVAGKVSGADAGIVVIKRPPQPLFGECINWIK